MPYTFCDRYTQVYAVYMLLRMRTEWAADAFNGGSINIDINIYGINYRPDAKAKSLDLFELRPPSESSTTS